jgi:phage terminase large subunit-like protein
MTSPTRLSYSQRAHNYARSVVERKIIASKWIRLACERHLDDLKKADYRWHFDSAKANRVCAFIETHRLASGDPFVLQDFQVWLIASLVAWVDESGVRKYIEAIIMIAKGNGKSPLIAALCLWFAFFDGVRNAEVYCGATNLKQAMEVFRPALSYVEQQPAYQRLGITAQKKSIFSRTGAQFQPVISRGKHGARPYLAVLDELHQALSADLYGTFKTGCNKTPNSLLLTISTAGVASLENPCHQLQIRAQKALDGSLPDDRLLSALYCADDSVEWTSEEALLMANPNLGVSNDEEKIRLAIGDAQRNPAHQNNVKAMHLNIWSTASAAWMNMQSWNKCADPTLTADSLKDLDCWIGSDLASKIDLSSIVKLFRKDIDGRPHYYCFSRAYLPEERVNAPENTHYQKWSKQGFLTATPGSAIDYSVIEADAQSDINSFRVRELCYDARYADQWSQRISESTGITRVVVPPSPAELSPAMKELEAAVYDGRFHFDGHPILTWCISNVLTRETTAGNYTMPDKERPESKIDVAIALFIAMRRAMVAEVESGASTDPSSYFMVI